MDKINCPTLFEKVINNYNKKCIWKIVEIDTFHGHQKSTIKTEKESKEYGSATSAYPIAQDVTILFR